jgi:hypothetical protein
VDIEILAFRTETCSTLLNRDINTEAETKAADAPGKNGFWFVFFVPLQRRTCSCLPVVMRFHWCLFILLALLVIGLHAAEVESNEFPSCAV